MHQFLINISQTAKETFDLIITIASFSVLIACHQALIEHLFFGNHKNDQKNRTTAKRRFKNLTQKNGFPSFLLSPKG